MSLQAAPTQSQAETPLQPELLPELTGPAQSPPAEHGVTPPSTVDTAALSEEPLPGEETAHRTVGRAEGSELRLFERSSWSLCCCSAAALERIVKGSPKPAVRFLQATSCRNPV